MDYFKPPSLSFIALLLSCKAIPKPTAASSAPLQQPASTLDPANRKMTSHHLVTHKKSDWVAAEAPDVGRCCHGCFILPPEQVVKGRIVTGCCRKRCSWCEWTECHCGAQRSARPAVTSCDTQWTLQSRDVFEISEILHIQKYYCSIILDLSEFYYALDLYTKGRTAKIFK